MSNNLSQNHAIMMLGLMNRLFFKGAAYIEKKSARIFALSIESTSFFLMGRDTDMVPFIAVPYQLQPYFSNIDWSRLTLFRRAGYVYLEVLDHKTNNLLFAIGFRVRKERQTVFHQPTAEDIHEMTLNLKTYYQNPQEKAVIADRNDITNIAIREIFALEEIDNEVNLENAQTIFEHSGAEESVSVIDVAGRFRR